MSKRYITDCNGQQVRCAYKDTGHGDSFVVEFDNGTRLYIWAFDEPYHLESVLYDPEKKVVLRDNRSVACKAACEKYQNEQRPFVIAHWS